MSLVRVTLSRDVKRQFRELPGSHKQKKIHLGQKNSCDDGSAIIRVAISITQQEGDIWAGGWSLLYTGWSLQFPAALAETEHHDESKGEREQAIPRWLLLQPTLCNRSDARLSSPRI